MIQKSKVVDSSIF